MRRFGTMLTAGALAASASGVAAQDTMRTGWSTHLTGTYESVEGGGVVGSDWIEMSGGAGRRLARGRIMVEAIRARRFEDWDVAGAVDGYLALWRGAHGNVRAQLSPDSDVLTESDLAAEVYQLVGQGFEVSIGYRRVEFDTSTIGIRSFGLSRYLPGWHLRGKVSVVPIGGDTMATMIGASVRRYSRNNTAFIELRGATGTEAVTVGIGPTFEMMDSRFAQLRVQHGVWRRLHFLAAISYRGLERVPDRMGGSMGILIE